MSGAVPWYQITEGDVPVKPTERLTVPGVTVWLTGCTVIDGGLHCGAVTVTVTEFPLAEPHPFVTFAQ